MIINPKHGQAIQVWYNKKAAKFMPYHGRIGIVIARGKGKPRNHIIEINEKIIIPCGNIRRWKAERC